MATTPRFAGIAELNYLLPGAEMTTDIGWGCGKKPVSRVRVLISGCPALHCALADDPRPEAVHGSTQPSTIKRRIPLSTPVLGALERADPPFSCRAPAESRAGQPGALLLRFPRQHDVLHPTFLRRAFIGPRGEAAIGNGQVRRVPKQRAVPIQCRRP